MLPGKIYENLIFEQINIDFDVLEQSLKSGSNKDKSLQKAIRILSDTKSKGNGISKLYPLKTVEICDEIYAVYAFSYGEKEIPEEILYELYKTVQKVDLPSIQLSGISAEDVFKIKLGDFSSRENKNNFVNSINQALYDSNEQIIIQAFYAPKNKKESIEASAAARVVLQNEKGVTEVCFYIITNNSIKNCLNSSSNEKNDGAFRYLFKNIFNP